MNLSGTPLDSLDYSLIPYFSQMEKLKYSFYIKINRTLPFLDQKPEATKNAGAAKKQGLANSYLLILCLAYSFESGAVYFTSELAFLTKSLFID